MAIGHQYGAIMMVVIVMGYGHLCRRCSRRTTTVTTVTTVTIVITGDAGDAEWRGHATGARISAGAGINDSTQSHLSRRGDK